MQGITQVVVWPEAPSITLWHLDGVVHAIKLDTGSLSYFHDNYEVETVNCKLIIED